MVKEMLKNLVSVMVHVFPRHPFVLCNVILPKPCDCVMMGSKEINLMQAKAAICMFFLSLICMANTG